MVAGDEIAVLTAMKALSGAGGHASLQQALRRLASHDAAWHGPCYMHCS